VPPLEDIYSEVTAHFDQNMVKAGQMFCFVVGFLIRGVLAGFKAVAEVALVSRHTLRAICVPQGSGTTDHPLKETTLAAQSLAVAHAV